MVFSFDIPKIIKDLYELIGDDVFWKPVLEDIINNPHNTTGIHLAIFVEPYLQYVLEGKKTVESRFSVNKCAPYGYVQKGDILLLKKSGGPIVGICTVSYYWYYQLNQESWDFIKDKFTQSLCANDPQFWIDRAHASFATLMRIGHVKSIEPFKFPKRDRRGWIPLRKPDQQIRMGDL